MPNGGSDCCGTCWFNSKNDGESGYHGTKKEGAVFCKIRNIEIDDPFYTYCINHPHHNRKRIEIPLGPVYSGEDRQLLFEAPDNEETRLSLVKLLEEIKEKPTSEYPFGRGLDEEVIIQIGKLHEIRAIHALKRIAAFNPFTQPIKNPFKRDRIVTVGLAVETLAKLSLDNALPEISNLIKLGLKKLNKKNYDPKNDKLAPIRYHAVRGLTYCESDEAIDLLKLGLNDPHLEIKAFAKEILTKKIGLEETLKVEAAITTENTTKKPIETHNKWWEFWKKNE